MHTSWRMQDGSAPAGMRAIAQTADGFLWFASLSRGIYRFDGVRFVPWLLLAGLSSIDQHNMNVSTDVMNVFGDHSGGSGYYRGLRLFT